MQRSDGPVYLVSGCVAHGRASRRRSFGCRRAFAAVGAGDRRGLRERTAMGASTARNRRRIERLTINGPCRAIRSATVRCIGSRSMTAPAPSFTCRRQPAKSCWIPRAASAPGIMSAASRIGFIRRCCAAIRRHGAGLCGRCRSLALIGASAGAAIGMLRLGGDGSRFVVALSRLAGVAPLARPVLHAVRPDLDVQRLAVDGQRRFVFNRQAG